MNDDRHLVNRLFDDLPGETIQDLEAGVMLYLAGRVVLVGGELGAYMFKAALIEGDDGTEHQYYEDESDLSGDHRLEQEIARLHPDALFTVGTTNDTYEGGYGFACLPELVEVPVEEISEETHKDIQNVHIYFTTFEHGGKYYGVKLTDETKAWDAPNVDQ